MWMLLVMLQSPIVPDAQVPVETFYQTQAECQTALKAENEQLHYMASCIAVTWK